MFIKNRVGGSSALKLINPAGQVEFIIMIKNACGKKAKKENEAC